ncbi:hypothetical protein R3W88_006844 [Solanum pinnatisectum]|uniref:Uncharacterized protein n=1 Tax=Solanum pinnatisectum TaxID=50273 RepID=A0AAV9KFW8_9SOLN|nr:hypothetical protein R3W88_006844 [Solanum pinnatisectum]
MCFSRISCGVKLVFNGTCTIGALSFSLLRILSRISGLEVTLSMRAIVEYQSAPPFYHGKKKFFATSEFSRKAAGNKNIKTVHDVPLRPETRAVRRLHHSIEAICLELPRQSSHQCDQWKVVVMVSSVRLKLVNIWNSKLQALGECTSTQDEESKRKSCPRSNSKLGWICNIHSQASRSFTKWIINSTPSVNRVLNNKAYKE